MMNKESKYINVKGQLMDLSEPRVMGILNVLISVHTPLVRMPTMFHWKKK